MPEFDFVGVAVAGWPFRGDKQTACRNGLVAPTGGPAGSIALRRVLKAA